MPLAAVQSLLPLARAQVTPNFTFTAAGDYGGITSGSNGQKVVNKIATVTTNFHIALGDLGYGAQNPSNWCSSFKNIYPGSGNGSLVLITGNHDTWNGGSVNYTDGSTGVASDTLTSESTAPHGFLDTSSGYVDACGAPAGINWVGSKVSYGGTACQASLTLSLVLSSPSCYAREYYFDYPSSNPIMRFIFISAGIGGSWIDYSSGLPHYNWLKARIDEAKNDGLWVAIITHKNCISDGTDIPDCASTFDPFNLAVTEMGGVDLWLDGHDHTYQRSYQLSNVAGDCSKGSNNIVSCLVAHQVGPYVRGQGTIVNIIGTGGDGNGGIQTGTQTMFASLCGSSGPVSRGLQQRLWLLLFYG